MEQLETLTSSQKFRLLLKLLGLAGLWAVLWLPFHSTFLGQITKNLTPSTVFMVRIILLFILVSLYQIVFLAVIVKIEKPVDVQRFFRIERLDIKGIWMTFGLGILLQIINAAFLWNLVLKPAKVLLACLGLASPGIGLGSGADVPALQPFQAIVITIFLLIFWWVEVPEEMFFRGYIQNNMQRATGKNVAMLLSALIWDLAHLWSLANVVERFLNGLVYAFVFRVRQNATGPMIVHPIGNRVLLMAAIIPQIWGAKAEPTSPGTWLAALGLYILLLLAVIALWRWLKLDRTSARAPAI